MYKHGPFWILEFQFGKPEGFFPYRVESNEAAVTIDTPEHICGNLEKTVRFNDFVR
jgi:hypothetical protein